MKLVCLVLAAVVVMGGLTGCTGMKMTQPYISSVDRTDQSLEGGNRGYIKGTPPPAPANRNTKRTFITVDVDLPPTTKEREEMVRESQSQTATAAVETKNAAIQADTK